MSSFDWKFESRSCCNLNLIDYLRMCIGHAGPLYRMNRDVVSPPSGQHKQYMSTQTVIYNRSCPSCRDSRPAEKPAHSWCQAPPRSPDEKPSNKGVLYVPLRQLDSLNIYKRRLEYDAAKGQHVRGRNCLRKGNLCELVWQVHQPSYSTLIASLPWKKRSSDFDTIKKVTIPAIRYYDLTPRGLPLSRPALRNMPDRKRDFAQSMASRASETVHAKLTYAGRNALTVRDLHCR